MLSIAKDRFSVKTRNYALSCLYLIKYVTKVNIFISIDSKAYIN